MDNNAMMKPAKFPESYYYGIRPTVSSVVAEMDDMSIPYPTQGMYEAMVDRVYDQIVRMYPDGPQSQTVQSVGQNTNHNLEYQVQQFFPPFHRRPLLRDLLGILILFELFDRRRLFW